MTASDRICLFLAEGTPEYDQLVALIGEPSSATPSIAVSNEQQELPSDEYVAGIDLESVATPFQDRLRVYGDTPVSTFSILC